ncbi:MAG: DinB family protein [Bacteroidota bacterium]
MVFDLDEALTLLACTPAVLDGLLRGLPDSWIAANEGPETFSPFDVVGHLIHGEETDWVPRARLIREHGASVAFEPYDRFAQAERFADATLPALLSRFAELRAANIATVEGWRLTDEDLAMEGRHPDLGIVTLRQLLATWTVHDLSHLAQVARVMAKAYADEVGPWQAYLGVLHRGA